ncbi:MAG: hypothetical protein DWQ31_06575 [Planctomycetota bacterium]|nr:MAG: hypothetical protein DWQ31_06575 [Planctomycetota bacterium]REJ91512.1 MAG: hypothetical protein DWQ35_14310 [Planctomycetota bacterium]REK26942.1 MAG: hypothetical protein DWQ42_07715 [Planctomycetota bacterium]REK44381.1 MAG: hypothetical protein DWQ46_09970 [Planctomycetota bacterium]
MQAYVINLAPAEDRWEQVRARLDAVGMRYTRIDAVNGRALNLPLVDFDEAGHRRRTGRRPIKPEIGCYLSHLRAILEFLDTRDEYGLILEDDALLGPEAIEAIDDALAYRDQWDILRLSSVNRDRYWPAIKLSGGRHLGVSLTRSKGASAYVINRRAAKTWVRELLPMRLAWDIAFDLEFFQGLKAMGVTPLPVRQDARFETHIQKEINTHKLPRTRYFTVFPFRTVYETKRFLSRGLQLLRLRLWPPQALPVSDDLRPISRPESRPADEAPVRSAA